MSAATDLPNNDLLAVDPTALSEEEFAALFDDHLNARRIEEQSIVRGLVVEVGKEYVTVDIAHKMEGQIEAGEFRNDAGEMMVEVGERIEVWLDTLEDEDGTIVLSKARADIMKAWERLEGAYDGSETIEGIITGRVKGGLAVDIGVKAFLPGSQVDLRPVKNLDKLVGTKAAFRIIKFNKRRGNIVLSRRVLLEEELNERRDETMSRLRVGAVVEGTIKNITDYGAFVDLGGIDGLLHLTDMSWGRINHPSEMFQVGDKVAVRVLRFDSDTNKVSLGFKQIREDPWLDATERYPIGSVVEGKVVSLPDYGAFIELEAGIEGLVHISEMTWNKRVKHPSKLVNIDDVVQAVVLDIDQENKRISLGMKQLEENPWETIEQHYPIGSIVEGPIRNITDFGIFVGVAEGIDGLVHISDLSWSQRLRHPTERFKKGDEVRARVMSINRDDERLSLSVKELSQDPWEGIAGRYYVGMTVEGKIVSVAEFGVFIELEEGIEGLVHKSELADGENALSGYQEGATLKADIISIDPHERKIGLSELTAEEASGAVKRREPAKPVESQLGDLIGGELAAQLSGLAGDSEKSAEVIAASAEATETADEDTASEVAEATEEAASNDGAEAEIAETSEEAGDSDESTETSEA